MKKFLVEKFKISESEAEIFSASFKKINLNKGDLFIDFGKVSNKNGRPNN